MTDATGTTVRTFDELGRVLTKTVPNVGTITYEYDITVGVEPGCKIERSIDPKGNRMDKVYDKAGRLSKVIVGNEVTTYTYFDNGNRESVTYNDGTKEVYTYYANNQIETLVNKRADGSIMDTYRYTYDAAGNQLTKYEVIGGQEKGTTTYIYDALNRLETVTEPNGRVTTYTYDKAGNREKEAIVAADNATGTVTTIINTYTYNNQNRLTEINTKVNNVLTEVTSYTYDNNGNQLEARVKSYENGVETANVITATNTYDLRNQLIRTITADGTIVENSYNAEGYRTVKEVGGEKTYYLYEGDKVILEVDDAGNQKARNVYGTNLLIRTVDGETYYYLYNGHADVTALVTGDGAVAAIYYYDAFGNILESSGEVNNNILYSGYQYDEETGLYYLNARMYDPKIARFLQEDTYTGQADDPLSLNLYTYCHNNPIKYWDPTGHRVVYEDGANISRNNNSKNNTENQNLIRKYKNNKNEEIKNGVPQKKDQSYSVYSKLDDLKDLNKDKGWYDSNAEGWYEAQQYYKLWYYGSKAYERLDEATLAHSSYLAYKLNSLRKKGVDLSELTVSEVDKMCFDISSTFFKVDTIALAAYSIYGTYKAELEFKGAGNTGFTNTQNAAQSVAKQFNGKLTELKNGYKVEIPNPAGGNKPIVVRIMNEGSGGRTQPYFRVSIDGKGSYTLDGLLSSDRALTHIDMTDSFLGQITKIINNIGR